MSASQVDNSQLEVLLINNQSSPVLVPSLAFPNPTGYPSSNLVTDISLVNCGRQTGRWYKAVVRNGCWCKAVVRTGRWYKAVVRNGCWCKLVCEIHQETESNQALQQSMQLLCFQSYTQQLTTQYTSVSNPFYWYKVWSQGFKWTVNCNNRSLFCTSLLQTMQWSYSSTSLHVVIYLFIYFNLTMIFQGA